jgi:protein gp37
MQKTGIEYLDYTWNPIAMRCTPVSPGCLNCWHLRTADRLKNNPGLPEIERRALAGNGSILRSREIDAPSRVKNPSVIGVQFMGDLYHETVSNSKRDFVYEGINAAPWHTYLILTKRPDAMLADINRAGGGTIPDYIRPGLTVCNQVEADEKIPIFLQVPGKKFLSIEPLLGPISFRWMKWISREHSTGHLDILKDISCVILGGETGPGARVPDMNWIWTIRDQCAEVGTPFFLKHISKSVGRLLDGRTHDDLPWTKKDTP